MYRHAYPTVGLSRRRDLTQQQQQSVATTLYNSILSECSSNAALFGLRKRVQTKFSCSFWPVSILFRRALELLNTKSRAFDDTSTGKTKSHLDELNLSEDERS